MKLNDVIILTGLPKDNVKLTLPTCQMFYHPDESSFTTIPRQCVATKQGSHDLFCANHQGDYWADGTHYIRAYKSVPEMHFIPPNDTWTHSDGISRDAMILSVVSGIHRHILRLDKEIETLHTVKKQRSSLITALMLL